MPLGSSSRACSEAGCHLHSSEGLLQDAGLYTTGKKKKSLSHSQRFSSRRRKSRLGRKREKL